jgi:hypothetical protein
MCGVLWLAEVLLAYPELFWYVELAFSTLMTTNELHSAETTWQADSVSASQEIMRVSCNTKVQYRVHKSLPLLTTHIIKPRASQAWRPIYPWI